MPDASVHVEPGYMIFVYAYCASAALAVATSATAARAEAHLNLVIITAFSPSSKSVELRAWIYLTVVQAENSDVPSVELVAVDVTTQPAGSATPVANANEPLPEALVATLVCPM